VELLYLGPNAIVSKGTFDLTSDVAIDKTKAIEKERKEYQRQHADGKN
jgi:hypothetical protein